MESCFQMILGNFPFESLLKGNILFGTVLFFVYNIMILFVLINMFLTILVDNYHETKKDSSRMDDEDPNLYQYIKSLFFSLVSKEKFNSRNGENNLDSSFRDGITLFPNKINQLLMKIEKVFDCVFSSFLT
jgi:hypothetical protein